MDSDLLVRFEAIARLGIAEDMTPEFSAVIDAVVAALGAAKNRKEVMTLLISLSCFTGEAAAVGIRDQHRGDLCEDCAEELIVDFAAGLGLKVTDIAFGDDEDDDEADLDDVEIASVH